MYQCILFYMSGNFAEYMGADFLSSVIKGEACTTKTGTAGDPFLKGASRVPSELRGIEEFNKIEDAIALIVKGENIKSGDDAQLMRHFTPYRPSAVRTRTMCALVTFEDRIMRDKAFCDPALRDFGGNTIEITSKKMLITDKYTHR